MCIKLTFTNDSMLKCKQYFSTLLQSMIQMNTVVVTRLYGVDFLHKQIFGWPEM